LFELGNRLTAETGVPSLAMPSWIEQACSDEIPHTVCGDDHALAPAARSLVTMEVRDAHMSVARPVGATANDGSAQPLSAGPAVSSDASSVSDDQLEERSALVHDAAVPSPRSATATRPLPGTEISESAAKSSLAASGDGVDHDEVADAGDTMDSQQTMTTPSILDTCTDAPPLRTVCAR
jgi:hypothetical protein